MSHDALRAIWHELAQRNEWMLVHDEEAFIQQATVEYHTLASTTPSNQRQRLAVYRAYNTLLYHGIQERQDRAFYEVGRALFRKALKDKWSYDEAEDIAQETIAQVVEKLDSLRAPESLLFWVFSIYRTVRSTIGKKKQLEDPMPTDTEGNTSHEVIDLHDLIAEAEQKIMDQEILNLLQESIPNDQERLVILRTVMLGDNPRDVAHDLGVPLHRTRIAKHRALKRLREQTTFMARLQDLVGDENVGTGAINDDR